MLLGSVTKAVLYHTNCPAQRALQQDWGVSADVWSVTSWTELRRDALAVDQWNLMHPGEPRCTPYVTTRLREAPGPVVAVSD